MNANVDESNKVYTFNVTGFISHKWYIGNISHRFGNSFVSHGGFCASDLRNLTQETTYTWVRWMGLF